MDEKRQPVGQRASGIGRTLVMAVILVLTAAGLLVYRGETSERAWLDSVGELAPITPVERLDPAFVAAAVRPGLVNIIASAGGASAAGSGIVLTAEGEVLTSHHVIKGAEAVTVTDIGDGRSYDATVLGYDSGADIALLGLGAASRLPTVAVGSSAGVRVRDEVIALGNAGGTGGLPTAVSGRVSDLDRAIVALNAADLSRKALTGMLEVEAAIAAGQSGGALADRSGAVIGVIAAAAGDPDRPRDRPHGYAVPIDRAMAVVEQIRSGTSTETVHVGPTATLGVLVSNALPTGAGARVDMAIYGMPAYAVGLGPGDVITSVDDRAVATASSLRAALNTRRPNDTVRIGVTGAHGERTVAVVLTSGPPS